MGASHGDLLGGVGTGDEGPEGALLGTGLVAERRGDPDLGPSRPDEHGAGGQFWEGLLPCQRCTIGHHLALVSASGD